MDQAKALAEEFLHEMMTGRMKRLRNAHHGFFQGEMAVLCCIVQNGADRPVAPSQISRELRISRAAVTGALNALEKKGLIHRSIDPNDRRRMHVMASAQAVAMMRAQYDGVVDRFAFVAQKMGTHEFQEFIQLLRRVCDCLREYDAHAGAPASHGPDL